MTKEWLAGRRVEVDDLLKWGDESSIELTAPEMKWLLDAADERDRLQEELIVIKRQADEAIEEQLKMADELVRLREATS